MHLAASEEITNFNDLSRQVREEKKMALLQVFTKSGTQSFQLLIGFVGGRFLDVCAESMKNLKKQFLLIFHHIFF